MEVSGQRHAPAALLPGEEPRTHCIGGRVCPPARLNISEKGKISWPCRDSNLGPPNLYRPRCSGLLSSWAVCMPSWCLGFARVSHWVRQLIFWVGRGLRLSLAHSLRRPCCSGFWVLRILIPIGAPNSALSSFCRFWIGFPRTLRFFLQVHFYTSLISVYCRSLYFM